MKKNIFMLLAVCAVTSALYAGDFDFTSKGKRGRGNDNSKLFVGFSVGAGLPMGNFGKHDSTGGTLPVPGRDTTKLKGFANTGFNFNLKAGYHFTKNVGGMIQIGGNMNSFNTSAFQTLIFSNGDGTVNPSVTASSHYIGTYLIGPFFVIPVGDKIDIDAHVLVGLMTVSYSEIKPSGTDTTGVSFGAQATKFSDDLKYNSATSFAYCFGAGLKFKLTDMVGITLSADYLGATPVFTGYTLTSSQGGVSSPPMSDTTIKAAMSTSLINVNVGAVFSF